MTLNEKISCWFEPFESLPPIVLPKRQPGMSIDPRPSHRPGEVSLKEAWKVGPGMKWYARKWDTDEAANARLLETMPEPHLWREPSMTWHCEADRFGLIFADDANRKTAIVMAFCQWAGIEED